MGKSTPTAPKPAEFRAINIAQTGEQATQADINSFNLSDEDFAARFPGLSAGRDANIKSAYDELTGPLDTTVQNDFVNAGLEKSLSAFGGGNPLTGLGESGSASKNTIASSVSKNVQDKQDYDRGYFQDQLAQNLPRAFGLSGSDAANLSIANTGNLNQVAQSNYVGSVNASNAQNAADAQNTQAAIGTALAVAGIVAAI